MINVIHILSAKCNAVYTNAKRFLFLNQSQTSGDEEATGFTSQYLEKRHQAGLWSRLQRVIELLRKRFCFQFSFLQVKKFINK